MKQPGDEKMTEIIERDLLVLILSTIVINIYPKVFDGTTSVILTSHPAIFKQEASIGIE